MPTETYDDARKLFVGRLPQDISEQEIEMVFATYGKVDQVKMLDREGRDGQRAAFVTYDDRQAAEDAIEVLNGQYKFRADCRENIQVSFARPRREDRDGYDRGGPAPRGSVASGRPRSPERHRGGDHPDRAGQSRGGGGDRGSRRSHDRDGHGRGGRATYDYPPPDRGAFDRGPGGCSRGAPGAGAYARGGGNGHDRPMYERDRGGHDRSMYDGPIHGRDRGGGGGSDRPLYDRERGISYDRPAYERDRGGGYDRFPPARDRGGGYERDVFDGPRDRGHDRDRGGDRGDFDDRGKGRGGKGGQGSKLYVANLPDDITKDAIGYVFETYGPVLDIHVMTGRSAKSDQACAFVVYAHQSDARRCLNAMQQGYEIRPGQGDIVVKFADDQREPGSGGRSKPY